jgi:hypothetical protein
VPKEGREKMKTAAVVALAALLLAAGSPGEAVMKGLATTELTRSSDLVVEGDVQRVTSFWTDDGTSIMSRATISVREVVRGVEALKTLTVEFEGGEVGDVGMGVSDMATVSPGQRVLMFLQKKASRNGSSYEINGRAQGLYKVGADGIARKGGFSLLPGAADVIDNDLDIGLLKQRIRGVR